jgi:hypothetical protein
MPLVHAPRMRSQKLYHSPYGRTASGIAGKASRLDADTQAQFQKKNRPTSRLLYPITAAILKIGRYIATTINPITVPKNTIIAGSSNEVSDATA